MNFRLIFAPIFLTLLTAPLCRAQFTGYINGGSFIVEGSPGSLTSFKANTGQLTNSFSMGGTGTPFAVAPNDITLYLPSGPSRSSGGLDLVDGANGRVLTTIPLSASAQKVVLTSQGGTAFVSGNSDRSQLFAINLSTRTVVAALQMPGTSHIEDLVLSPDDATLYVSLTCGPSCETTPGACPVLIGVCAYDTKTLAFKGSTSQRQLHGFLAVSQDSKSLYVTGQDSQFYVAEAAALTIKYRIPLPFSPVGPAIVDPVGHYAIVLTGPNGEGSTTAYTLDTSTNKIVAEFFADAPKEGAILSGSDAAAFAPNGHAVWMLVATSTDGIVLAELGFPSGQIIHTVPVPVDSISIAFPRVTTQ